jgi:molybdopterin-guanine dinucleotide biosynthesis protein B
MKLIGLAGWSGAGKTTLLMRVIPLLIARGLTVSTIKHAHHSFDVDVPGKDSHRHREAGATEVLVSSGKRFALMHELREEAEWPLADLLRKMSPVDLLIIEGFKRDNHPKIEVHRAENGKPHLFPEDKTIVALASDMRPDTHLPLIHLDDAERIAATMIEKAVPLSDVLGD